MKFASITDNAASCLIASEKGSSKSCGALQTAMRMRQLNLKMAEFPELGKRCDFENCKILDFLPFMCNGCGKTYCVTHKESTSHNCNIISPAANNSHVTSNVEHSALKCSYLDCKNRELIPITCQFCHHTHCLMHRHQRDHDCEKLKNFENVESKTALLVKSILNSKSDTKKDSKPSRNKNAAKIKAQVNLMKTKLNATGEKKIPSNDCVFFNVILPVSDTVKAFFFSKTWTVGRVVDYVAAHEKLANFNNVSSAKKIKLFGGDYEDDLPTDSTLDTLLANEILFNGQNLFLKYIN